MQTPNIPAAVCCSFSPAVAMVRRNGRGGRRVNYHSSSNVMCSYNPRKDWRLILQSGFLGTVPACQNLYKNSFTYHCLQDNQKLPFDDAIQFLEQCEKDRARVLVHCMSGKNRSPAIVIAFLMKSKGWKLAQSYQWVKERRPSVELNQAVYQQLREYELKIFGSLENNSNAMSSFSFGFARPHDPPVAAVPTFNNIGETSVFSRPPFDTAPQEFTFGARQAQTSITNDSTLSTTTNTPTVNDITMGGS